MIGKDSTKIATKPTVKSFLLLDNPDTSSKGPGCLNTDMKITMNAKNQNSLPARSKVTTDTMVKTYLNLSETRDFATCPPSSIAAGSRLSIVTTIPTHPAHATG